jgi:hypothetical protein
MKVGLLLICSLLGHVYSELTCFKETEEHNKSWVWSSAIGMTKIILVQLKFPNNFAALSNYLLKRHYWTLFIALHIVVALPILQ